MVSLLVTAHHVVVVLLVVASVVAMVLALVVSSVIEPRLLLGLHHLLMETAVGVHLTTSSAVHAVHAVGSSLRASLVELEGRLEKHGEQINEVLRATQASQLLLVTLALLLLHGSLVDDLFISDESHLLGVAVLNIQSILRLEQHISCKILRHLALVLLLEVHKGLLGSMNDLDLRDFTLACRGEVDLELVVSGSWREVLDEQTEEHDRLLVFEVVHGQLLVSLTLLLCLSDVQLREFRKVLAVVLVLDLVSI